MRRSVEDAMQSFRSYLGLPQNAPVKLTVSDSIPNIQVMVEEALDLAMKNSPDPEYYERIRLESKSNLAQAKASAGLKADIYFQLGLSQTGADVPSTYRSPNNQMYASVSFSLPILDWGRGKGRVKVARSQVDLTQTQAEQGMQDFTQNVQRLVMQFNMQQRKVKVATLTNQRSEHRYNVARKLFMLGRSSVLDLNSAISEKNSARRSYITALQTYWQLYYTLRSMTAYDIERKCPLSETLPIN